MGSQNKGPTVINIFKNSKIQLLAMLAESTYALYMNELSSDEIYFSIIEHFCDKLNNLEVTVNSVACS